MLQYESSEYLATTTDSKKFPTALVAGATYILAVSTDSMFTVGATGGSADKADGSHFLAAGSWTELGDTDSSRFVHVEAIAEAGHATLSKVDP